MQAQLIGPLRFITKRVMAEDLLALCRKHRIGRRIHWLVAGVPSLARSEAHFTASTSCQDERCPGQQAAKGDPASRMSKMARALGKRVPNARQGTSWYKGIRTFHFSPPEW
jgi:hypothetical protein